MMNKFKPRKIHSSHSQPEGPRTDVINRLETQQPTVVTHTLKIQEDASSAGLIHKNTVTTHSWLKIQGWVSSDHMKGSNIQ